MNHDPMIKVSKLAKFLDNKKVETRMDLGCPKLTYDRNKIFASVPYILPLDLLSHSHLKMSLRVTPTLVTSCSS